ncbi:MAG: PrsW family intramembrane metalloprotease, partial [Solobacterium sp.]|nr:PrsW family intramembrane metalloprotease [Solobacterium sp.]
AVSYVLNLFVDNFTITAFAIVDALTVGMIEEGAKFHYMKKHTWNDPNFNYTFDGIIYAVFVSLGFAAIENVLYVFMYGISIAFTRAILSIPAHLAFSVYMGVFYSKAKVCDAHLHKSGVTLNLFAGYLTATLLHWIYDGMLMVGSDIMFIAFIGFVILLDISVFLLIRNASNHDKAIY